MFRLAVGATASCTWLPCESECFFKFLLYASPCAAAQSASCLKVGKCWLAWTAYGIGIWQRPAHAILASLLARALKSTVEKSRSKPFGQSDSSSVKLAEWHFFVLLLSICGALLDAFASGPWADTTPSCSLQSGGPQSLLQATCFSQAAYTFQTSFADLSTRPTSHTKITAWLMWLAIPLNNIWPGPFLNLPPVPWDLARVPEADLAAFLFGVLPVSAGWATKCFSQAANSSQSDPSDWVTVIRLHSSRANALNAKQKLSELHACEISVWKIGRVTCSSTSPLSPLLSMHNLFHFEECPHLERLSSYL